MYEMILDEQRRTSMKMIDYDTVVANNEIACAGDIAP